MKYLKLFNTHAEYEEAKQSQVLPNVSHCIQEVEVHYNPIVPPIQPLIVTYNVELETVTYNVELKTMRRNESQLTKLYFYNTEMQAIGVDMFDKVEIDGTDVSVADLDANNGLYQLSIGEHTVAYTLKDPTIVGAVQKGHGPEFRQIGKSTYKVGAVFIECNAITNVTIPNSVTTIGISAFGDCRGLTSITIPNSVTSIGKYAFCRCPLDAASKAAIEAINHYATDCPELK